MPAKNQKTSKKADYIPAVGRRKTAVARIRLYRKKGPLIVNDQPIEQYFPGPVNRVLYLEPLRVANLVDKVSATIKVVGGGKSAQLGAVVHGLARALVKLDEEKYKPLMRKKGFLTRDPRMKERRKPGLAQKARAEKQSPKR